MSNIAKVWAREILDSRGNPTVEVDVLTGGGFLGRAAVPSGASTGVHEAHELRDGGTRFCGKGVQKAIGHVNELLAREIVGMDVLDQSAIDSTLIQLDGTENKSNLGANGILGVSLACARAGAQEAGLALYRYLGGLGRKCLPVPLINVLNGGAHANNGLDIQEFMLVPLVGGSFAESLRAGTEIFHSLKKSLDELGKSTAVGDEGGLAPRLGTNQEALELLLRAVERAGYRPGKEVYLALDVAATELYDSREKTYRWDGKSLTAAELQKTYQSWTQNYPILSIEDAFAEDDWDAWKKITRDMGEKVQLVGDDLFVTHPVRVRRGIREGAGNALLVKLNQIGTLTEALEALALAQQNQMKTIVSHRSGETEDSFIADLAVGLGCQQIKTGGLCRSERVAKYNQLLRIEEELGNLAEYWGNRDFIGHLPGGGGPQGEVAAREKKLL